MERKEIGEKNGDKGAKKKNVIRWIKEQKKKRRKVEEIMRKVQIEADIEGIKRIEEEKEG